MNPILEELYDIRRQIQAEHRDDLDEYLRAELERAKAAGHPIAKIKQRTIRSTGATKPAVAGAQSRPSPPGDR